MQDEGCLDSSNLKYFQNKSQVGYFCMLCMFLQLKGLKQIRCFESSWLLFMVSFVPMNVNKFRIPNTKHFIKGVNVEVY